MTSPILLDTGPMVAILSESDAHHEACVNQLRELRAPLASCWPVITEAAWLLRKYPRAVAALLAAFQGGPFRIAPLDAVDVGGITAILNKYKTLNLQLADAALLHLANREGIDTIFTLDRRDFGVLKMANGKKVRLIP